MSYDLKSIRVPVHYLYIYIYIYIYSDLRIVASTEMEFTMGTLRVAYIPINQVRDNTQ